jgi:hypothetical protein
MRSSYPASHTVAPKLASYFAQQQSADGTLDEVRCATAPSADVIEAFIGAAFWASLKRQEDADPTISLAYLPPGDAEHPLLLETPLPLEADSLAKLAPAVERPGIHLGVWHHGEGLAVWGVTHTLPPVCFVIEVVSPGLLVVKSSVREAVGKFVNLAVLEGDQIKELSTQTPDWPDRPAVVEALLGLASSRSIDSSTALVHLAASMRRHGRGGSVLIVPPNTDAWRASVVSPVTYSVAPLYSELRDLMCRDGRRPPPSPQDATRVIDMVAGLTAVDGASVLTEDFELLAFGVKIARRKGQPQVERVMESEPVGSGLSRFVHPSQLGGTRHLSAAQFAQDQRDAVALVASQDGRFTVFAWSTSQDLVHAYRVEALLL